MLLVALEYNPGNASAVFIALHIGMWHLHLISKVH